MDIELKANRPNLAFRICGEVLAGLSVVISAAFILGGLVIRTDAQVPPSARKAETIVYGDRIAMEADVTSKAGINTANAVIGIKLTAENARAFCEGYARDKSRKCIDDYLRETELKPTISANCPAGTFQTSSGHAYKFLGKNPIPEARANYIVADSNGKLLKGDMASGLYETMAQFSALCPKRVADARGPAPSVAASFDCTKAKTDVERTICGEPTLAKTDGEMGRLYKILLGQQANRDGLVTDQQRWVRSRNQKCAAVESLEREDCLLEMLNARMAELRAMNVGKGPIQATNELRHPSSGDCLKTLLMRLSRN